MGLEQWSDFYVATAGASAALAGLVIVAISVNVKQVIAYKNLPSRAAATIGSLILILAVSAIGLMPKISLLVMGLLVLILTGLLWIIVLKSGYESHLERRRTKRPVYESLTEIILGQIQIIPFVIGSCLMLSGDFNGLYWLAAGILTIFVLAMVNAWVLLVEILR